MSQSAKHDAALLRELDRSVRWAERRARAAHFGDRAGACALGAVARAGAWVMEGLVLIGSPWVSVQVYGRCSARGAWRRRGTESDDAEPG